MLRKIALFTLCLLLALGGLTGCQVWRNSAGPDLLPPDPGLLRVGSYNVHYIVVNQPTGPWSRGDWERRKGPMDSAFKALAADVVAFQEMESFAGGSANADNLTLDHLLTRNPGYAAAATGDPDVFPSTQPILYRRDRLRLQDEGWFFFSDTPDRIYSRTFNGSYPAFASWAAFELTSGEVFRVVNLHFDYRSRSNRLQSAELVADRAGAWIAAGETVFLTGDLNARLGARTLDILTEAGFTFTPVPGATYHFNRGLNLFGAIDHIATSGTAQLARGPFVLREKFAGEWPTDHYPVVADFTLSP